MQQKIRDTCNPGITRGEVFIKEAYKALRNTAKKLEDISKIEEKLSKNEKVNAEQEGKLKNKQEYRALCENYLSLLQLYEKHRPQEEE